MVLENLQVKHKAFGFGNVVEVQGNYIKVRFDIGDKTFVYPDIFEKFLTLSDGTVSEEITSDLQLAKQRKDAIIAKKNEENLRAMTKGIVIPGKEFSPFDGDEDENKNSETEEI